MRKVCPYTKIMEAAPKDVHIEMRFGSTPKSRYWRVLRNVLRAISLFKHFDALAEPDLEQLLDDIKKIPSDKVYRQLKRERKESSAAYVAIQDIRREDRFFKAIERSAPEDLHLIAKELDDDPYRFLRETSHPLSLVNKRNHAGQTPLYVACKNGETQTVSLLLGRGADPLIYSEVAGVTETNLLIAARWGHVAVVQLLLNVTKWSQAAIAQAYEETQATPVQALLRSKKKFKLCCF